MMADDIPSRVAVLEQIARNIDAALSRIDGRLIDLHKDMQEIRKAQHDDFRFLITLWLSGVAALLAVMAHGFRWI